MLSLVICCLAAASHADDTRRSGGGDPMPLGGATTVKLLNERVTMNIGRHNTTVDSLYQFKNDGPAAKVRVGFPAFSGFAGVQLGKSIRVWVSGDEVKTTGSSPFIDGIRAYMRVTTISFPANSTVIVHSQYKKETRLDLTPPKEIQIGDECYTLDTAAGWYGPIQTAMVTINFDPDLVESPVKPIAASSLDVSPEKYEHWGDIGKDIVYFQGPGNPAAAGHTMRFFARNFKPDAKSNIRLWFGPKATD